VSNFRPFDRDTDYLLPPSIEEWLPQEHLARFVVEAVGAEPELPRYGFGIVPPCAAVGCVGVWLRDRRVLQPQAGAGDV
jgi:hypothetical protein